MAEKSISDIIVPGFTSGDAYWRIDWLGDVPYPHQTPHHSQPYVQVILSKLAGNLQSFNNNQHDLPKERTERTISLPIGFLPLLRAGDIWRKNKYVFSPNYTKEEFIDIEIDEEHCFPIIAGGLDKLDKDGEKIFFLPAKQHPFHMKHTQSKCRLITLDNRPERIIIPNMEIVRFYFGSSPVLIRTLFTSGISSEALFDSAESIAQRVDGSSFLQLRTKMKDASAADIARIAFNVDANNAAMMISKSCVKSSMKNRPIYIETNFPFHGKTTLSMTGKWLRQKDGNKIFLCYRIIQCSAPFPFTSLDFFRDNAGERDGTTDESRPIAFPDMPNYAHKDNEDAEAVLSTDEPYSFIYEDEITIPGDQPFPDLQGKMIQKVRQESCKFKAGEKGNPILIDTDRMGIGEMGSDSKVAPVDIVFKNEKIDSILTAEKLSVNFENLFKILAALKSEKDISSISYIAPFPGSSDIRFSIFPPVKTKTGQDGAWPFLDYIKGVCNSRKIRRRVLIVKIIRNDRVRYLLEFERRVSSVGKKFDQRPLLIIHNEENSLICNDDFKTILTECAQNRGAWIEDKTLPKLKRIFITHRFSNKKEKKESIIKFAKKIFDKL